MYKEALIRNTYQGILANRPRDLTEEELEALELEQLRIGDRKEEEVCGGSEGPREGMDTPTATEANITQQSTPSSILRVGLGLPPLSGHCPDSPMSLKAAQSTSATWRHTVCLNTAPSALHQQHRTQLLYTPVSLATGGETMTDRVSYTNNTEAGSVMSWVQDDEDAFYEQLAEDELPQAPVTKQRTARKPSEEEDEERTYRPQEDRTYRPHEHNDQPKKGGRNGKKRSGGGGSQWRDVKKGAAPSAGKPTGNSAVTLSGGRFDTLRR
eukprot:GILI01008020.1.p1 GENE.GILI01008020.1~~GILI01008020.1.p1  ORF type:complete len:268 (-),score=62.24 GILI01008020.1:88-891(-)